MTRRQRQAAVARRIGNRRLIWYGTRGSDSQSLLGLGQLAAVFSIIVPLGAVSVEHEVCLESLKHLRVDLDAYRPYDDASSEALAYRRALLDVLDEPTVIASYRSDPLLTTVIFPRQEFVTYLGMFHERQAPFEHKPWVESELRKAGVSTVPWRYLEDEDRQLLEELAAQGPIVVRSSRSDGGVGLALVREPSQLHGQLPRRDDRFISVTRYLSPSVPLNVNACVFQDGGVSLHAPSVQLIGVEGFTKRRFGYCGNDFASPAELEDDILDAYEAMTRRTGQWLAQHGYYGAFGVDALVVDGEVLLTEINPRFQGSSHLSALIDMELGRPDMFLQHLAAFLGLDSPPPTALRELARSQERVSHVICHNVTGEVLRRKDALVSGDNDIQLALLPDAGVSVEPEGILCRAVVRDRVTDMGSELLGNYSRRIRELSAHVFDVASGEGPGGNNVEES